MKNFSHNIYKGPYNIKYIDLAFNMWCTKSTVCPKKRTNYYQIAITPLRIVEIKKVGRDSERARADLSVAYNNFSVTQLGAEIFEFKDDPEPKYFIKKYCR